MLYFIILPSIKTPRIPTITSTINTETIPPAIAPVFEFEVLCSLSIDSERYMYDFYQMDPHSQNNIWKYCFRFFLNNASQRKSKVNVCINKNVILGTFCSFNYTLKDLCNTLSLLCYFIQKFN